jgi:hypothetical protein
MNRGLFYFRLRGRNEALGQQREQKQADKYSTEDAWFIGHREPIHPDYSSQ